MRTLSFLLLLIVATACSGAPPETIAGRVVVTDGDSFAIAGTRIRLNAIDAPEGRQTCVRSGSIWSCGEDAAAKLRELVAGRTVTCTKKDQDSYGRMVAVCSNGTVDLGSAMVSAGLALAYRQYGNDYVEEETAAHAARRGVWAGEFTPPWEYRQAQRGGSEDARPRQAGAPVPPPPRSSSPPSGVGCAIKGNINRAGERIYHVPGSSSYEETIIDPGRGERMFCTEQEAQAAGWRAPRGR